MTSNHDLEMEDLIPPSIWLQLIKDLGDDEMIDSKERCSNSWHFRISKAGKEHTMERLRGMLTKSQAESLVWLAEEITRRVVLLEKAAESARTHKAR